MTQTLSTMEHPQFNPDALLDDVMQRLKLPNDAALARRLKTNPPYISKIRHRRLPISSLLLISIHEETDVSIRDLRYLSGDFRDHTGKSAQNVPPGTSTTR
ncbi:hypothetical protein LPN04_29455 [Rugamonas sp. A1-17]|nr:hypothetical protein [Rugamonas sp. A1-17]